MKAITKVIMKVILVITCFSLGCDDTESFDYIVVTVNLKVFDFNASAGTQVSMKIQKAGGEKIEDIGTLGSDLHTSMTGVFKLYREQPIDVSAYLVDNPSMKNWARLEWTQVDTEAEKQKDDSPRVYTWDITLQLI